MKKKLFCYACGKSFKPEELRNGLCKTCFEKAEKEKILKKLEKAKSEVIICRQCLSYFSNGKWIKPEHKTFEKVLERAIKEHLKKITHLKEVKEEVKDEEIKACGFELRSKSRGNAHVEFKGINLSISFSLSRCEQCIKAGSGYYEAIIQLRGDKNKIRKAEEEIISILEKEERTFISKREEVKIKHSYGADLYISSAKTARKIARHFKNRYGAEIKESAKLYSRKEGKNLYRTTFLIRL